MERNVYVLAGVFHALLSNIESNIECTARKFDSLHRRKCVSRCAARVRWFRSMIRKRAFIVYRLSETLLSKEGKSSHDYDSGYRYNDCSRPVRSLILREISRSCFRQSSAITHSAHADLFRSKVNRDRSKVLAPQRSGSVKDFRPRSFLAFLLALIFRNVSRKNPSTRRKRREETDIDRCTGW